MRGVSARRLFVAMAFGVLGAVVAIALDAAINFLRKDWTNPVGIVLTAGVAAISGIIPLLRPERERSTSPAPGPAIQPYATQPYASQPYGSAPVIEPAAPPKRRPSRRVPVVVGLLVLLLVCGGGVSAVTFGAQYLGGWVTGNEEGFDVLDQEATARSGDLTLTVLRVKITGHYTRVEMSARNDGSRSITLPVFENCLLNSPSLRSTLKGDSFRSDWTETIPPGQTVQGTVNFDRLPDDTTTISISFATIYGPLDGNTAITIADIPIR
jgi:hypothetical protein